MSFLKRLILSTYYYNIVILYVDYLQIIIIKYVYYVLFDNYDWSTKLVPGLMHPVVTIVNLTLLR